MKINMMKNEMNTIKPYRLARINLGVSASLLDVGAPARDAGGGERELQFEER